MSDLLSADSMLRDAQWNIEWRKKEIIKAKIRYDFTGQKGDESELNRHLRELDIEENYLSVLVDKLSDKPEKPKTPRIVKWALGIGE